jgi:hypothetical protein
MKTSSRRTFMLQIAATGAGLGVGHASAQARLDESDPQAVALGYRHDTTKVDRQRFPRHSPDQLCNNCALYQGKASDAWAGCPLFPGKQVAGKGWCSAWAKKAA